MKTRSSSPPVHVHVPDSTSVHVHLKKSPQKSQVRMDAVYHSSLNQSRLIYRDSEITHHNSHVQQGKVSNLRSTASVKVRAPWVPPGKTSRRREYKWEVCLVPFYLTCQHKSSIMSHFLNDDSEWLYFNTNFHQGATRCLEIAPGRATDPSSPPLRLTDLSSEDDDARGVIGKYERKIESLMSEVDCMKSEVWVVHNHDCKMNSQSVVQYCGFECLNLHR